jgi:hypothetical protein
VDVAVIYLSKDDVALSDDGEGVCLPLSSLDVVTGLSLRFSV